MDLLNTTYLACATTRGHRAWFANPDRAELLCHLICAERGQSVLLHAFSVMPTHYHLLVTLLGDHRLPRVVQKINSLSARQINAAVGREGRLWANRFYDHGIRGDEDFYACADYIHDNPRVSGLAAVPADYPYSSAALWDTGRCRWGEFDPMWP
jgi:REP element-mobilizing transposase RayT